MQDNDRLKELEMDSNRHSMMKINKLFKAAFWVCAVFPALEVILGLINILSVFMSVGLFSPEPAELFVSIFIYIIMLASFIWSYRKDVRGTAAAVGTIIMWWLINFAKWTDDLIFSTVTLVWLGMQIACLTKYKKLKFLQDQPGYPDFNSIYFHKTNNRIVSDEQVKEQLKGNKNPDMENMNADGSLLEENHLPADSGNKYMEDIFTDDLHKDI